MAVQPRLLTESMLATGWLLADALVRWQSWSHRKVETVDLLPGARGRRRVSIDFTSPGVVWQPDDDAPLAEVVPLTFLTKSTLREFDLRDEGGNAVSMLPSAENGVLAAAAVAALLAVDRGDDFARRYWPRILEVATVGPEEAELAAGELILELGTDVVVSALLRDLARNFLLLAVLPPDTGAPRRILKFSYHWDTDGAAARRRPVRAGLGFSSIDVSVALSSLDSAASFHLECAAPRGFQAVELVLPSDRGGRTPRDLSGRVVSHAHGNYGWDEAKRSVPALIRFTLDPAALIVRVMWSSLAVAALFGLLLLMPGSLASLGSHIDPAVTLLVFFPAFLIVLGARENESSVVTRALWMLRSWSYLLALMLVVAGSMLVLDAPPSLISVSWWCFFTAPIVMFLVLLCGWLRIRVISRG